MAIRYNPAYRNDVNEFFKGLSSLFAPPSAQDRSAYAKAAATREQSARLAELYSDPHLGDWDRRAIAAGLYNPTQSYYAQDQNDATARRGQDLNLQGTLGRTAMEQEGAMARQMAQPVLVNENQTAFLPGQTQAATGLGNMLFGNINVGQGEVTTTPDGRTITGPEKPLTESELKATILAGMPIEQQQAAAFGSTPIEAIIMDGEPVNVTRPQALGQTPASGSDFSTPDNYLVVDERGETQPVLAHTDPRTGRIIAVDGTDITDRVVQRLGTGGGINFEVDGEGGIRFSTGGAGGTVSNTTSLLGSERENLRAANELSLLYDTITAADVGIAGNVNEFLTDYGAQLSPGIARSDVAATRAQLEAMSIQLARTLSGDSRISNMDREAAQRVMVDQGLGESLPGAKAKLAMLVVLHAYRSAFASDQLGGERLPPINGEVLGQLVDRGLVSPPVAQEFNQTVLARRQGAGAPGSGVNPGAQSPASPEAVEPIRITSDEEYEALPSGATYIGPDGTARRKR